MSQASTPEPAARRTARLAALDHAHVWHPFTAMRQWREQPPLIIERGEGPYLFDTMGKRYIDGVSSLWCNVHGHHVPEIDQAIGDQLGKVAHTTLLGLASPPSIELAARLVGLVNGDAGSGQWGMGGEEGRQSEASKGNVSPPLPAAHRPLTKVFYSDAGSTALEVAFKMAVGYWHHHGRPGKCRFIGLEGAYHGDTVGSMSVGYSDLFHLPFRNMVFPVDWFPNCDPLRAQGPPPSAPGAADGGPTSAPPPWPSENRALMQALMNHSLTTLERMLDRQADDTAAIVIEPVMQGAAGMICQPPGFLAGVAALARKHDVLLICDEVATGFARTGQMFAFQGDGGLGDLGAGDLGCVDDVPLQIQAPKFPGPQPPAFPDILCLAKGLTAGYLPLAVTMTTDAIEQAFTGEPHERKTLFHGHTYTGNPLACAAALANLDLIERSKVEIHKPQVESHKSKVENPGSKAVIDATPRAPALDTDATATDPEASGLDLRPSTCDFLGHTRRSAELIREKLHALRTCPHVADIRQRGLMVGIELGPNPHFSLESSLGAGSAAEGPDRTPATSGGNASRGFTAPLGHRLCAKLRDRGVILRPLGNVIILMPIPATPHGVLTEMLDIVVETIRTFAAHEQPPSS